MSEKDPRAPGRAARSTERMQSRSRTVQCSTCRSRHRDMGFPGPRAGRCSPRHTTRWCAGTGTGTGTGIGVGIGADSAQVALSAASTGPCAGSLLTCVRISLPEYSTVSSGLPTVPGEHGSSAPPCSPAAATDHHWHRRQERCPGTGGRDRFPRQKRDPRWKDDEGIRGQELGRTVAPRRASELGSGRELLANDGEGQRSSRDPVQCRGGGRGVSTVTQGSVHVGGDAGRVRHDGDSRNRLLRARQCTGCVGAVRVRVCVGECAHERVHIGRRQDGTRRAVRYPGRWPVLTLPHDSGREHDSSCCGGSREG